MAALAVVATAFTATPAHAGTADFAGTVVDSSTGEPLAGVCVLLFKEEGDTAWEQYPEQCTEADGRWSRTGLDPGTYFVQASAFDYVTQYAYGHDQLWDADRFTVSDGDVTTVDLAMERAGSIAGTITDAATGDPIDGACVSANGVSNGHACTGEDGTYSISGLRPGDDYVLHVSNWRGGHLDEYVHDTNDWEAATRFTVVAGETLQVDEDLARGATISGTVTDAATGAPAAGACVLAMAEPESFDPTGGFACADEEGRYQMTSVVPGSYHVVVDDESGAHPRTWYPGTTDPAASVAVTVKAGQDTSGIDVALSPAAYLSGTVTRASTGERLADVCVYGVRPSDGTFHRGGGPAQCTDAEGRYTLGGLPAGDVKVFFNPIDQNLLSQWAYGQETAATASVVTAVVGETTSGVDAAMVEGGRITGRVVDAKTKQPVEGVCATVGVYSHRAGENGTQWPSPCTGPDGRYAITGLPTGSYSVEFYDPEGAWAWQFFPNKGDRVQAAKLAVTAGTTLAGINAKVYPGGTIEGVVLDSATGEPADGVCVDAFTARGHSSFGTSYCTGTDGRYVLRGFPTTKVKVQFFDGGGGYAEEWAVDATGFDTATAIPTRAGGTTPLTVGVSRSG